MWAGVWFEQCVELCVGQWLGRLFVTDSSGVRVGDWRLPLLLLLILILLPGQRVTVNHEGWVTMKAGAKERTSIPPKTGTEN